MKHHLQATHISQLLPAWLEHERVQTADLQAFAHAFSTIEHGLCIADFFENVFENTFFYTKEKNKIADNSAFEQAAIHDVEHNFEIQVIEYQIDKPINDLLDSLENCHFKKAKKNTHYKGVLLATPTTWYYLPKLKLFDLGIFLPKNNHEFLQVEIPYTAILLEEYSQNTPQNTAKNSQQNADFKTRFEPLAKLFSPRHLLQDEAADYWERWATEMNYVIGCLQNTANHNANNHNGANHNGANHNVNNLLNQVEFALEQESHLREYAAFTRFYGDDKKDRQRGAAYYLTTIWLGRILFSKLVETRLIRYHASDDDRDRFLFLSPLNFADFKELNAFFVGVFQTIPAKRTPAFKAFAAIPYLNSSIFKPTLLEEKTISAAILSTKKRLPLYYSSLLKADLIEEHDRREDDRREDDSLKDERKKVELPVFTYLLRLLQKADFGTNTAAAPLNAPPKTLQLPLHALYSVWEYWATTTGNLPYFVQSIPFHLDSEAGKTAEEKVAENSLKTTENRTKIAFLHTGGGRMLGKTLATILQNTPILNTKTKERYSLDIHFANDGIQPILPNGQPIDYAIRFERRLRKLPADLQAIQEAVFYTLVDIFNHKIQIFNELPHLNWATNWRLQAELLQFCFYKQGNNTQLEPFPTLALAEETGSILYERPLSSEELEQLARKEQRLQKVRRELYEKFPQLALLPIDYSPEAADEHQVLTQEIANLEAAIAGIEIPKTAVSIALPNTLILALTPQKRLNFAKNEAFLQTIYHTANNAFATLYIENLLYRSFKKTVLIAVSKDDLRTAAWKKLQHIAAQQQKTLLQIDETGSMKLLRIETENVPLPTTSL
ncbi:MAG: hypothetical protein RI894_903 [Bacteroidota bacterium]